MFYSCVGHLRKARNIKAKTNIEKTLWLLLIFSSIQFIVAFGILNAFIDASTHRPIAEKADWPLAESNANNATKRLKRKQKNTRLSVNKKRRILKKLV